MELEVGASNPHNMGSCFFLKSYILPIYLFITFSFYTLFQMTTGSMRDVEVGFLDCSKI